MSLEPVVARLKDHEGFREFVYDDATGQPIGPGSVLVGNPTIGYGWALNKLPILRSFAEGHLRETIQEVAFAVHHQLPWITELDVVRHGVVIELAYNLGVTGLLGFVKMLDALRRRRWTEAKAELLASHWATQVGPERRETLARLLETG